MVGGDLGTVAKFCAVSAALSMVICYNAQRVGHAMRLMDKPDGIRKLHATDTPLIGGLALLVPSLAVGAFYLAHDVRDLFMLLAVGAAAAMLLIGLIDDRAGLSAVWRVVALAALVFAVFALGPQFVLHTLRFRHFDYHIALPLGALAAPIVALMIVGFVNAVNMADGMNGQLFGSIIIWSGFIAYYLGIDLGLPFIALLCSAAVTLIYNMRERLFAGSSGAYAAALFVALGAIVAYRHSNGTMPAEVPVFWFWLPVLDCLRLMATRALARKSPFAGDRNHFHHMLLDRMRVRYALMIYLGLLAAPGAAAIVNIDLGNFVLLLCIGCYAAIMVQGRVQILLRAPRQAQPSSFGPRTSALQLRSPDHMIDRTASPRAIGEQDSQHQAEPAASA